jgi:uncharacterized NAD(P)/FAD-binding protein YdhS
MIRIVIIGAGLSGRLVALNLLRHDPSPAPVSIQLIDRSDERDLGPAYSTGSDALLLNVPAGRMGAFSEDPEHFLRWVRDGGGDAGQWGFLPRRLYRDYILALVEHALRANARNTTLEYIQAEVTDIDTREDRVTIHAEGTAPLEADRAVLALGNFPPRQPAVENSAVLQSRRYVPNPWRAGVLDGLAPGETVFLI